MIMIQQSRNYSVIDHLIHQFDWGLRTLVGDKTLGARPNPSLQAEDSRLSASEKSLAAGLMRINEVGEIAAQALYQSQSWVARTPELKQAMLNAAREEQDHLVWCKQRLIELDSHSSYLNPLWYLGSLAIGSVAGVWGDRWNLGFIEETEHQVIRHLDEHLKRLPQADHKSRRIIEQMKMDEEKHATAAHHAGAALLPEPIKQTMRFMSKVMTTIAFWI